MLTTLFLAGIFSEDYQLLQNIPETSGVYLLQSLGILSLATNMNFWITHQFCSRVMKQFVGCQHIPSNPLTPWTSTHILILVTRVKRAQD